jgi:hypothetical protein
MNAKSAIIVASVGLITPAYAGGFLGDMLNLIVPGTGIALDSAHQSMGQAIEKPPSSDAIDGGFNQSLVQQSKVCVTPRGVCPLGTDTLKGTTCFCSYGSEVAFGRMQ